MAIISTIFLSGWFQLALLITFFVVYSQRVCNRQLIRGYGLGWMVGVFVVFIYLALNPPQSFYISDYDYKLNIFQVIVPSLLGIMLGGVIIVMSMVYRSSKVQRSLSTAVISGVFVIAIFAQLIATPDARLMVSLFIVAFTACILTAHILLGQENDPAVVACDPIEDRPQPQSFVNQPYQAQSRIHQIRQQMFERSQRNGSNVPTNIYTAK